MKPSRKKGSDAQNVVWLDMEYYIIEPSCEPGDSAKQLIVMVTDVTKCSS